MNSIVCPLTIARRKYKNHPAIYFNEQSISYELLKASAKYENNIISKILVWPGLMFQKITTQPPDDKQIEIAIASLKKLLETEKGTST